MSSKKPPKMPKTAKKYDAKKLSGSNKQETLTYVLGGVAIVAIIALIVIFVVIPGSDKTKSSEYQAIEGQGITLTADNTVFVGDEDAPVTLEVFEDFICPACGQFENQYGGSINEAVSAGDVAVEYHTLNFLNQSSTSGDYSSRAAGALMCVAEQGDAVVFSDFHAEMFAPGTQPPQGSDMSDDEFAAVADEVGADDSVITCIEDGEMIDRAEQGAESSTAYLGEQAGQVGTPAVLVDGEPVEIGNPNWLDKARADGDE